MTTASTVIQLAPPREVSLARFGAASHRTFKASSGEVEVNGEAHPRISTSVTVVTAAIGTEVTFYALKSSMTAFHPASKTFITEERLNDVPNVPEELKALLHQDAFWKDPRNQHVLTCFDRIVAKNMKCLETAFSTPLGIDTTQEADMARILENPDMARVYIIYHLEKHMDHFGRIVANEIDTYARPWQVG